MAERAIPESAVQATCPKCGEKFIFRARQDKHNVIGEQEQTSQTRPQEDLNQPDELYQNRDYVSAGLKAAPFCPWESAGRGGYASTFLTTVWRVLTSPQLFFQNMPRTGGLVRPLLFSLIIIILQLIVSMLWLKSMPGANYEQPEINQIFADMSLGQSLLSFVLAALMHIVILFVNSALIHMALRIFHASIQTFELTFRIFCYASSPMLLAMIPLLGYPLATIWSFCCLAIGCRYIFNTPYLQVIPAIIMAFVAILGIYLCLILTIFGNPSA